MRPQWKHRAEEELGPPEPETGVIATVEGPAAVALLAWDEFTASLVGADLGTASTVPHARRHATSGRGRNPIGLR